jgi:hypothetical protein
MSLPQRRKGAKWLKAHVRAGNINAQSPGPPFGNEGKNLRETNAKRKHQENDEHEFVTRGFTIGQGVISLLPMEEVEEGKGLPVLPFQSYYSLLSRAPTRLSPDLRRSEEGSAVTEAT